MPSKGAATHETIVDAGVDLVSTVGFDGLTIGQLAERVGMSKSGLFGHFQSKEQLQLDVLAAAVERYTAAVVLPALEQPRGEPRVRAFFDNWLEWARGTYVSGGCIFIAAANELDDRDGELRERLVSYQQEWIGGLSRAAEIAVEQGHFRADLDSEQFAWEFYSIILAFHHASRLLRDDGADARARTAFDRLLDDSQI